MGAMSPRLNLYTIGSHRPFLTQLAQSWLGGALDVGPVDDPLARIDTTFYLPTRRAARAFADVLTNELGGTALLPTIRTLADADEDEFLIPQGDDPDQIAVDREALEPPNLATMPGLKRRLILTRLIGTAGEAMRRAMADTNVAQQPVFPQSVAESAHLAKALADLIDQVATEESDWQALFDLVPDDHAAYWQLTLTLLTLVTQNWPAILTEEGVVDPATRRRLLLDARTARILAGDHPGPVIAAGSTGSIPATARLLSAIAHAPKGAVVLPGLDQTMPDAAFDGLGEETPESASHPQHGLYNLLATMQANRADVTELAGRSAERQKLVSAAFLPATETSTWSTLRPDTTDAFDQVTVLEAASEGEESLAIAMAMKASLARDETVALVTPDRNLARRVQLELERFGLSSDDSAGTPLRETPPARLMLLAADAWKTGFAAIPLLALLKHPLCALGEKPAATRADARLLERLALRGLALAPGLDPLREVIHQRAIERDDDTIRVPAIRGQLGPDDDARALALIDRLETAFAPLAALDEAETPFAAYTEALFTACEALAATDDQDMPNLLYAGSAGEALAALRLGLREAESVGLATASHEAPTLLEALLAEAVVRPEKPADPRLHIWGPLEARLQAVDHIILGGLNEKVWPNLPTASPFLSRAMMAGMHLAIPERRIGLSAHDVEQALGQPKVTLTRALKVDGAPTVPSRWLQRLLAFLPEETGHQMRDRAAPLLAAASAWDHPDRVVPRSRPEPKPKTPPTRLSITEVETLIRDPYTVYARRVLKLEEAPGLGLPPGPAERGTLFHALFEALAPTLNDMSPEAWPTAMQAEADRQLQALDPFPDIQALWAQRIARVLPPYLEAERQWSAGLDRRVPERGGALELEIAGQVCRLTGRADRIDLYADGTATILDFKTGNPPSLAQVKTFAPQLPLSVAMLGAGGFKEVPPHPARAARYVQTGGNRDPFKVTSLDDAQELHDLAVEALAKLEALWATFLMGAPFTPLLRPERARDQGPYHQLARVKEWRAADESTGDGA
jgi:ATP-dependent helicase/nuclease subunit B